MPVNIQFENIGNPFSNISYMPPYVTKTITPIFNTNFERNETKYTFNGQITGKNFTEIKTKVDQLFSNFSAGFYPSITIDQEYNECCQLDRVSIDAANYVGIVPYTVEITCHDKASQFANGVKNVSREISYQETEDNQLQISHRISVDGIRTASVNNALTNARNFIVGFIGNISDFGPYWNGVSLVTPTLISQQETINAIDGNISIDETYRADAGGASGPLLRYTISIDSGVEDGNVTLGINGNIVGGKSYSLTGLKNQLSNITTTNLPYGLNFADFEVVSKNFDYNENENILNFSISRSNDDRIQDGFIKNYNINVDYDFIQDFSRISYNANLNPTTYLDLNQAKTQFNSLNNGLPKITNLIDQSNHLGELINQQSLHLTTKSVSIDENNATISTVENYDDSNNRFGNLIAIDYSIKIDVGLDQYSYSPILDANGSYVIENLKYKRRTTLGINGSAGVDITKVDINSFSSSQVIPFINKLRNDYFKSAKDLIMTKSNISINKQTASCSFDVEFTADSSDYN